VATITIELPDEIVPSAISPEEFARELRLVQSSGDTIPNRIKPLRGRAR